MNSPSPSNTLPPPEPELLQALNQEQREAVLSPSGPTLILAGAGTGKTRVIVHRVAQLLRDDPSLTPENVLALTFSRKAAEEMRERVEELLGAHPDEMAFFTFHGFCHRFLQEHSLELKLPPRLRLLDQAEAWVFFRKLLLEMKLKQYGSLSDPPGCIDGFLRFIGRAKDEMVSPEELAAYARSLEDKQESARAAEMARVYGLYQKRMKAAGCLDFGDLVAETIRALRERPGLLKKVRAQYRAVLVDEFQDTNVAQIELLRLLSGPEGNLCVVGDDDQAIYRFRGASFASFLLMKKAFPSLRMIRLTRNYRSTPSILAAAERLIRHNEPDRYDPEKKLRTENPDGPPVEMWVCPDEQQEAEAVARKLRQLYESQPEEGRRWDRMAVLYRAHAHRERLMEVLQRNGIPFTARGGTSLFEQPAVKDLAALLQVLWDPADSVAFFRLLSHPVWALSAEELMAVSRLARERDLPILRLLENTEEPALTAGVKAAAERLRSELAALRGRAVRLRIEELVPEVVERSFLRVLFRLPAGPGMSPPAALARFLRITYRYAQNTPEQRDLGSFLWYLDSLMRASAGGFIEEEEAEAEDGVRLMTVHQAKGLEFDWVVLLEMVQGRFPARERSEPIPFPVELMKQPLPKGDYHLQEERRLCYVACTRAKKGLFLVTQDRTRKRSSLFLQEMQITPRVLELPAGEVPFAAAGPQWPAGISPSSLAEERELLELMDRVRSLDPKDKTAFTDALDKIQALMAKARGSRAREAAERRAAVPNIGKRFSFSQLETYRYCPLKYLYAYVYRIPVRPVPHLGFGSDLHKCLEQFYAGVIEGRVAPVEELIASFRRLHAPGRYGEAAQDQEYRQLGERILTEFYEKQKGSFTAPLFVEKSFLLEIGDVLLKGVVDRADRLEGGGVEIVDYKSGKPKEKLSSEDQLQLRLYALAAKEVFGLEPRRLSFYYLRENRALSFDQKPSDFEQTRERILELVGQVQKGDFTPSPSKVKCRGCDFKALCPASLA